MIFIVAHSFIFACVRSNGILTKSEDNLSAEWVKEWKEVNDGGSSRDFLFARVLTRLISLLEKRKICYYEDVRRHCCVRDGCRGGAGEDVS